MDERSQVALATLLGAVLGGVFGCLYLTDRGRRIRTQIEPMLDMVIDEIDQTRKTVDKAREAANEGRRALDDVLQASAGESSSESRDVSQDAPAREVGSSAG